MSKAKIIASVAASAAFAVMPAAATFAVDTTPALEKGAWIDQLDVTVAPTCSFTRDASAPHASGADYSLPGVTATATGTWTAGPAAPAEGYHKDTLAGSISGNSIQENFGSSKFRVICNNSKGWTVTTTATELTGKTTTTEKIPLGSIAAGTAAWQYTITTTDTDYVSVPSAASTTSGVVISAGTKKTTGNDGKTFDVQYGVSTDNAISAQTYEGTITYTFAEVSN